MSDISRTTDASPAVLIALGFLMVGLAFHDLLRPEGAYAQEYLSLSNRPDTWRGRAWDWWVKRGFSIFILLLPGLVSLVIGIARLLQ